ncbi:hypothetical protein MED121_07585 [Marinomonas sp. MED121]|uniref:hypothetical protein n=1 Tax=Marinomonas sp. MED121 TaxID=314277 RepID=UPI000069039D|nr:hypothetical protein [Marinomonas sp. MED121]EAQ66528.1 hypothetical protein MED121_07585 [Marinomonas sp. MED121]
MNIINIVESQITQRTQPGNSVSHNAQFALLMSLFTQPGPSLYNEEDTLNQHSYHAVNRPISFNQPINDNPQANIALLKALGSEPLMEAGSSPYDAVESVNNLIASA